MSTHPLDGAWLRFSRADKHLSEAHGLIREYSESCKNHIVADNNHDPLIPAAYPAFILNAPPLPVWLPVVISDTIHNLRAALDYIVFELARKDSGKVQNGTQFLIEDSKSHPSNPKWGFDGKKGERLKGLCAKHVDMIESLQPYMGVDWTKTLRDISNPDKHRELTVINAKGLFNLYYRGNAYLNTQEPEIIDPNDWDVDASNAIHITPPDLSKPGLIPTLLGITAGVCSTLELFKVEF